MVGISTDYYAATETRATMDENHCSQFVIVIFLTIYSTYYVNVTSMKTITFDAINQSKLFCSRFYSHLISMASNNHDMEFREDRFWLLGKL